ncbi:MAG: hypothetical protein Q7T73_01190, partial [Beijerinckiaceae bacterium]|nr:hypothetical protein [Beijerinckiaceae bacterium]
MRHTLFACSLLALSLTLTGCNSPNSSQSGASAEDARWSDATAKQLREAISRRAAHGLDRMGFSVPAEGADQAALTQSA